MDSNPGISCGLDAICLHRTQRRAEALAHYLKLKAYYEELVRSVEIDRKAIRKEYAIKLRELRAEGQSHVVKMEDQCSQISSTYLVSATSPAAADYSEDCSDTPPTGVVEEADFVPSEGVVHTEFTGPPMYCSDISTLDKSHEAADELPPVGEKESIQHIYLLSKGQNIEHSTVIELPTKTIGCLKIRRFLAWQRRFRGWLDRCKDFPCVAWTCCFQLLTLGCATRCALMQTVCFDVRHHDQEYSEPISAFSTLCIRSGQPNFAGERCWFPYLYRFITVADAIWHIPVIWLTNFVTFELPIIFVNVCLFSLSIYFTPKRCTPDTDEFWWAV